MGHALAALRMIDVIRYETNGKQASCRLKHPRHIRQNLSSARALYWLGFSVPVLVARLSNWANVRSSMRFREITWNADDELCSRCDIQDPRH